jgi:hypothetical protein
MSRTSTHAPEKPPLAGVRGWLIFVAIWVIAVPVSIVSINGCSGPLIPLGDASLSGRLPKDWEDAPLTGNAIVRVIKLWQPVPWEILVYPAPEGTTVAKEKGWTFVKEESRPGPSIRVGDRWELFTRAVWIYRAKLKDGRILESSVDKRFDTDKAEEFLNGLQVASE